MNIWRNFKTLIEAKPSLSRRSCFAACYLCKKIWVETNTTHVHMCQPVINGGQDTRFICDSCEAEASHTTDEEAI